MINGPRRSRIDPKLTEIRASKVGKPRKTPGFPGHRFHYVEAAVQVAIHNATRAILDSNAAKDRWLRTHWPAKGRDLGGYEHAVPSAPAARADVRDLVLGHLRLATPATCPHPL